MKPNCIYILADDMGVGDVACLDQRCAWPTPHLDQLAAEGMRFQDAHSSSAVCTPSRYSILTGRYAWRSWLKSHVLLGAEGGLLAEGMPTMASMLQSEGYRTACVGKWHMGWEWACKETEDSPALPLRDPQRRSYNGDTVDWIDFNKPIQGGPCDYGFDEFFGIAASLDMPPYVYVEGRQAEETPTSWATQADYIRPGPRQERLQAHRVLGDLTDRACSFISKQTSDEPFFLYLALTAPHTPIAPAPEFIGASGVSGYGDFCMEVDHRVGQVMAALQAAGVDENTLVIFTSDNGCSAKPANCAILERHFNHYSSSQYRGYKSDIWDGGHRVPFIARWPAALAAGGAYDKPIGIFDIYATMAELTGHGLAANEAVDSHSFAPILRGLEESARPDLVHHSIDGRFALRSDQWKLCRCPGSGGWSLPDAMATEQDLPPIQLYDMHDDCTEADNLAAQHPDIVQELTQRLHSIVTCGSSRPGAQSQNDPSVSLAEWQQIDWRAELPAAMIADD